METKDTPEKLKDEEILRISLNEDPDAFAELVDRYEHAFLRKAYSVLKNREDAEDMVQDAFTKIYLHGDKYENMEGASFSSWAYKILINTCLSKYNKKKRRKETPLTDEMKAIFQGADDSFVDKLDAKEQVLLALSRIPEHLAKVLKLQFLEGYSQKEIAEEEDLTVGAVKTRVFRAKAKFREVLEN